MPARKPIRIEVREYAEHVAAQCEMESESSNTIQFTGKPAPLDPRSNP